jgi:hypothetical protein
MAMGGDRLVDKLLNDPYFEGTHTPYLYVIHLPLNRVKMSKKVRLQCLKSSELPRIFF